MEIPTIPQSTKNSITTVKILATCFPQALKAKNKPTKTINTNSNIKSPRAPSPPELSNLQSQLLLFP